MKKSQKFLAWFSLVFSFIWLFSELVVLFMAEGYQIFSPNYFILWLPALASFIIISIYLSKYRNIDIVFKKVIDTVFYVIFVYNMIIVALIVAYAIITFYAITFTGFDGSLELGQTFFYASAFFGIIFTSLAIISTIVGFILGIIKKK